LILAIASGKGGTGKTTVAVSLARVAAEDRSRDVRLLDCDVEGPNADLSLRPRISESRRTGQLVPVVNMESCSLCGRCAEVCAYGAISVLPDRLLILNELCMGCGSCVWQCPEGALDEELLRLGELREGAAGRVSFAQGRLDVGRARATPVIRELKKWQLRPDREGWYILDAPPGSACATMEALRGADAVLLVAEPTPLGLHDLALLVEGVREGLDIPMGVIINRSRGRDEKLEEFCLREKLPILGRIAFSREIASAGAEGKPLDEILPSIRGDWHRLLMAIETGEAP